MPSPVSSTNRLYVLLIMILGIVLGYIYYNQYVQPNEVPVAASPVKETDTLKDFQNIRLDFSVLDAAVYKNLQIFGEVPVVPGATGKRDIFAPF
ncbi:MAG TPA: hypothetical protein VG941_01505 [Candidatus Paceibacterota bacterium]|nr:hypothetical protein [Candidatus Paceibacterota bacterium]